MQSLHLTLAGRLLGAMFLAANLLPARAQTPPVLPHGVPEPGLVIWGSVVNADDPNEAITVTSVSWSVTDSAKTAVYTAGTSPPTQILTLNGRSFYVLQVPFDTRRFDSIVLNDPATEGIDSFELRISSPPTFTLTPTINGVLANVRSIDGAPAAGGSVPVSGFTRAVRGRVLRVDLAIVPLLDDYDAWAISIFGSLDNPDAARMADPDGDGMTNEGEHAAGTDPRDPDSLLRILSLNVAADASTATLQWLSASARNYVIEVASDPQGPWTSLSSAPASSDGTTEVDFDLLPLEGHRFFRVRVEP